MDQMHSNPTLSLISAWHSSTPMYSRGTTSGLKIMKHKLKIVDFFGAHLIEQVKVVAVIHKPEIKVIGSIGSVVNFLTKRKSFNI